VDVLYGFSVTQHKKKIRSYALDFVGTKLVIYYRPNDIVTLHLTSRKKECLFGFAWDHPSTLLMVLAVSHRASAALVRRTFNFSSCRPLHDFHFDTHHFVQRLEREGLNRAQAEGIMTAMAEVIDESIRNMTSNMVTKAEQEKVSTLLALTHRHSHFCTASLYPAGRLCADQVRATADGEE
jgi:hypothetical protein